MQTDNNIIAAAYARYSTDRQQETSIIAQLNAITDYAAREGIMLTTTPYIDEARSGTNTNREGFQRLLADARRGLFNAVIVYDISRGSRNVADWYAFRAEMGNLGIRVLSVTDKLGDPDDPSSFLSESLSVVIAQHQVLQSRQKSIAGKRVRAQQGLFCGGYAPLGYEIVDGHYMIVPHEAEAVREAFRMYAAGHSYNEIVAMFDRAGVRGRLGRRIEANTLHYILRNPRYTGQYIWFENVERHMHKHVGKKADDPTVLPDAIPRIVSNDIWLRVQARMKGNKKMSNASKREYLLSGIIRCGVCGAPMFGVTRRAKGREYIRYVCSNKYKEKNCHLKDVKAEALEGYIVRQIRERILAEDIIDKASHHLAEKLASRSTVKKSLEFELTQVQRQIDRVMYTIKNIDIDDVTEIGKELQELTSRKKDLTNRIAHAVEPEVLTQEQLIILLREDAARLAANPALIREMILRYVRTVTVYDIFIDVSFCPDYAVAANETTVPGDAENGCKSDGSPGRDYLSFTTSVSRESIAA